MLEKIDSSETKAKLPKNLRRVESDEAFIGVRPLVFWSPKRSRYRDLLGTLEKPGE